MASIKSLTNSYRGKLAANYDVVRDKQMRWHDENRIVERMLSDGVSALGSVLDVPVGTGRFMPIYKDLGLEIIGVDSSEEMLAQARVKCKRLRLKRPRLVLGNALDLPAAVAPDYYVDVSVCVRFLNLIEETAMREVMKQLFSMTRSDIILTIRLGEKYASNSKMCTHDSRKFRAMIRRAGWRVAEDEHECFRKGWHLMRLERAR